MAIQKSKSLPNGVVGNYWKITEVQLDALSKSCSWRVELFLSAAQKNSESLGVALGCSKSELSSEQVSGDLRALGYAVIKDVGLIPDGVDA